MPCICDGSDSGKDEFDRFKRKFRGTWDEVHKHLKTAAQLIDTFELDRPAFKQEFHELWMTAFAHHLLGCPEKAEKGG